MILATAAFACLHAASSSLGEVTQKGEVRVSVTGSMSPKALPRHGSAPIAVSVAGHIATVKRGALPKLKKISIALNRNGRIDSRGIPLCRLGHIEPSTTQQALAACGPSLVGEGSFSADVRIPEQSPFPSSGRVLAFNGVLRGRPVILAHIYGTEPVPTSYVLPFSIVSAKGTYGTVLEASLPQVTGEWGYVTGIGLKLDRGSYVSAGCPAPKGFPGAVFPFARTSFAFSGGLKLTTTLNRSCKAKE